MNYYDSLKKFEGSRHSLAERVRSVQRKFVRLVGVDRAALPEEYKNTIEAAWSSVSAEIKWREKAAKLLGADKVDAYFEVAGTLYREYVALTHMKRGTEFIWWEEEALPRLGDILYSDPDHFDEYFAEMEARKNNAHKLLPLMEGLQHLRAFHAIRALAPNDVSAVEMLGSIVSRACAGYEAMSGLEIIFEPQFKGITPDRLNDYLQKLLNDYPLEKRNALSVGAGKR